MADSFQSQHQNENEEGSPPFKNYLRTASTNLDLADVLEATVTETESIGKKNQRNFVDHTYHDFSQYFEGGGEAFRHKKAGKNFPATLHRILSDSQYSHIISWMVLFCRVVSCS